MRGKDRHNFCAWGAAGGYAGTTCGNVGERSAWATHDIGKQTVYRASMDEVIRIWSGGGGGWGDPLQRDPDAVAQDVAAGLVSLERADLVYGVVITHDAVQAEATELRRIELGAKRGPRPHFDFGQGRDAWEATYGVAAQQILYLGQLLLALCRRCLQVFLNIR